MGRSARNPFANLREFLRFWVDERPQLPCCRFASEEELESDPEQYDCETCAVQASLLALRTENREAWRIYEQLISRFTFDTHSVGVLLERVLRDREAEEAVDLVARLALIYDEVVPVTVQKTES